MLRDKLMAMPGRVKLDYRGCGEQQVAGKRRFEARYGVRIVETQMAGMYSNVYVDLEDVETGERVTVNGYYPQQTA